MKRCIICHKKFYPSKYNYRQSICVKIKCKKEQKRIYAIEWRKKNPDYFKDRKDNQEAAKIWRLRHPDYYSKYRKKHPELKIKNREYVRNFRQRKENPLASHT